MKGSNYAEIQAELLNAIALLHSKVTADEVSDQRPALKEGRWYLFWVEDGDRKSRRIKGEAELSECIRKYNNYLLAEWLLYVAKYARGHPPKQIE